MMNNIYLIVHTYVTLRPKCLFTDIYRSRKNLVLETGNPKAKDDLLSTEFIIGTDNYNLFEDLKVAQFPEAMRCFGKHPVIWLDLTAVTNVKSKEDAINICRCAVHESYLQHQYLTKSSKLDKTTRNVIATWCDEEMYASKKLIEITTGIIQLTDYLKEHWGRQSLILVDEYDSIPMKALLSKSVTSKEVESITGVVTGCLLAAGKSNPNLGRMVVTGIAYIPGIWSLFNNVVTYEFLENHPYGEYYGLTESEVKDLLKKSRVNTPYDAVSAYYNGYVTLGGKSMYNIWSVLHFLEHDCLSDYWVQTGSILGMVESFKFTSMREKISKLLKGGSIDVRIPRNITVHDMQKFLKNPVEVRSHDLIFSFFLTQGCLSHEKTHQNGTDVFSSNDDTYKLKLPNREITKHFQQAMDSYYTEYLSAHEEARQSTAEAYEQILKSIHSKEELETALEAYIEAIRDFAEEAFKKLHTITHEDLRGLVTNSALQVTPRNRMDLNNKIEFPDGSSGWADYCGLYETATENCLVIMEIKVIQNRMTNTEAAGITAAKNQIIKHNYIGALDAIEFKDASRALVMGLRLIKPNDSKDESGIQIDLIYKVHKRGDDPNIGWIGLSCEKYNEINYLKTKFPLN